MDQLAENGFWLWRFSAGVGEIDKIADFFRALVLTNSAIRTLFLNPDDGSSFSGEKSQQRAGTSVRFADRNKFSDGRVSELVSLGQSPMTTCYSQAWRIIGQDFFLRLPMAPRLFGCRRGIPSTVLENPCTKGNKRECSLILEIVKGASVTLPPGAILTVLIKISG
jgi:hypothetical protein